MDWREWLRGLLQHPLIRGAGAVAAIAVALLLARPYLSAPPPGEETSARISTPPSERSLFTRAAGVAVLKSVADATWEKGSREYQPGDTLLPGWMRLRAGAVQIEFARGARVVLEGPAELNLISAEEAHLKMGRLRAHVSESASGFRVTSDSFVLVDRGTEFGCQVPEKGEPEVYVFQGAVEMSSPRQDWAKQSIQANQAVAVSAAGLRPIPGNSGPFLGEAELAEREQTGFKERLSNWRQQAQQFSENRNLVLHYTFEDRQSWERTLRNRAREAPPGTDATLVGCNWTQGRWPGKGAVEFSRNDDRLRTHVPGTFQSLTFLAWLRVDSLPNHYTSLAMTESLAVGEVHWSLDHLGNLLLSARKGMPASPLDWEAAVAYGAVKPEMAGSWILLTSVYDAGASTVTHFVNGETVTTRRVNFPVALHLGDLEIGNWGVRTDDPHWTRLVKAGSGDPDRSFKGRLDEFALFSAPLSPSEIRHIYDYGKTANSIISIVSAPSVQQTKQPNQKPL